MAIPSVLTYFILRRKDVTFPSILWLFAAFIVSCGLVHFVEAWTFWYPLYRLSGVLKVITACVSFATVIALIRILPIALDLPGLATVNAQLSRSQSSLKERSARLEQSNKELEEFAYVAAHDLRSPLRAISQLTSWVREDDADNLSPEGHDHLNKIAQRVARLEQLLADLLAYSRAGTKESEFVDVDTGALVDEIAEISLPPDGFVIERSPDMPTIHACQSPLRLVFLNLISNAVKHHGSASGRVTIGATDQGDHFEFYVKDDGPGIDPKYHERVFGLFQTLKPKDEEEGSGLGLAIVKKTLLALGGTIRIESAAGDGTTVYFTWPISGRTTGPK